MGVFDQILGGQSNAAVEQVARQFGIDPADARKAMDGLAPVVARGLQQNAVQTKGADELFEALRKGNHGRYLDDLWWQRQAFSQCARWSGQQWRDSRRSA